MAVSYDAGQMLIKLGESLPPLYQMVTGAAYVIGIGFALAGIYHLKIYGEMRTMMASQTGLKEPATYLFVAAIFIFIPTGFSMVMNSTFGYGSTMAYAQWPTYGGVAMSQEAIVILKVIQLIGIISFIRGWIVVQRSVKQQSQGGGFGKGLSHVIGGVFAANIVGSAVIVSNTLGIRF